MIQPSGPPDKSRVVKAGVIGTGQYATTIVTQAQSIPNLDVPIVADRDIDAEHIGYFGFSWGAWMGMANLSVEPRIKAGVLYVGGLLPPEAIRPEADPFSYVSTGGDFHTDDQREV